MKAYKLEVLVIDLDDVGDAIASMIENQKYPNYCISPQVVNVEEADIGDWHDNHPLNGVKTWKDEYNRLFNRNT